MVLSNRIVQLLNFLNYDHFVDESGICTIEFHGATYTTRHKFYDAQTLLNYLESECGILNRLCPETSNLVSVQIGNYEADC